MLNLRHVQSFLAVLDHSGFGAAAEALGVSQAAVSQRVRKLEEALGHRLVDRAREACRATPAGRDFLPYARALLRTAAAAVAGTAPTRAAVGASSNIGLYWLPTRLRGAQDHVDLTIGANPFIAEELANGRVDVALMEWWDRRKGFDARCFHSETMVSIVPPGHPWNRYHEIPRERLVEIELLGGEPGTGTGRLLATALGDLADRIHVRMRLGSTEAVKRWVRAGFGASLVLAGAVERERAEGSLHVIEIVGPPLRKELWAIAPEWLPARHPAHEVLRLVTRGERGGIRSRSRRETGPRGEPARGESPVPHRGRGDLPRER